MIYLSFNIICYYVEIFDVINPEEHARFIYTEVQNYDAISIGRVFFIGSITKWLVSGSLNDKLHSLGWPKVEHMIYSGQGSGMRV